MYGSSLTVNVEAPNIDFAFFNTATRDELTLVMRNAGDSLVWDAGSEAYFNLEGSSVAVTGGSVEGHTLVLTLDGDGGPATGISYMGHVGAGPWVTNGRGVGMLAFSNVPIAATAPIEVTGRFVAYGGSAFGEQIAPDKSALLPGETATAANVTSFSGGINRVVVDIPFLADPTSLGQADFAFRVGDSPDVGSWTTAPSPTDVTATPFGGVDGADRIVIAWPDAHVAGRWLEVTVRATANTGIPEDDVFYFGNIPGETTAFAAVGADLPAMPLVNAADVVAIRDNPRGTANAAAIDNAFDVNRDMRVDAIDLVLARNRATSPLAALPLIAPTVAAAAPAESEGRGESGERKTQSGPGIAMAAAIPFADGDVGVSQSVVHSRWWERGGR